MERNFYNDDFEELLKEKADQYKMYPSDKVWNGIQNALHSRRKWYWLGFALLLSGVSYYAVDALIAPSANIVSDKQSAPVTIASADIDKKSNEPSATHPALVIPLHNSTLHKSQKDHSSDLPFYGVFRIDRSYASVTPGATDKITRMLEFANINLQNRLASSPMLAARSQPGTAVSQLKPTSPDDDNTNTVGALNNFRPDPATSRTLLSAATLFNTRTIPGYYPEIIIDNTSGSANTASAETSASETGHQLRFPMEVEPAAEDSKKINWLQEYATAEFQAPRIKRTSLQLSFSPTMNYRKLAASRNGSGMLFKQFPMALSEVDPDQLVSHKPALGFELGTHLRYALSRTVTLKTGLQFNYSRYSIAAFSATPEVATIALNSANHHPVRRDSILSITSISNFGGNSVRHLQNQYFQLSAPIGLEVLVIGGRKLGLHLAGTMQPTFLINRNSYLITTDYKNYTKEPSLVRRWNMNTSAEAFVSYNTGSITWQVGPQFRYQLLSTYSSRYPIRENLMEYGVKIGVSKTIK